MLSRESLWSHLHEGGFALVNTVTVRRFLKDLEGAGCDVTVDWEAGVAKAKDGPVIVYAAIQKGRRGPWIVRFHNSEMIRWSNPTNEPEENSANPSLAEGV